MIEHLSPYTMALSDSGVWTVAATHGGRWAPVLQTRDRRMALDEYKRLRTLWLADVAAVLEPHTAAGMGR